MDEIIEIADAMDVYVKRGDMRYNMINGFWSDAGSFDSLLKASLMVRNLEKRKK